MADYKSIHGTTIKSYTTDPDNPIDGQVWFDKTNKVLQFEIPNVTSAGAWRTGGSLNTSRTQVQGAGANQNAALAFGGDTPPATAVTEKYNGSSWTEVSDLTTARRQIHGAGTYTAALVVPS